MQHDEWLLALRLSGRNEGAGQKKRGQGREELWLFHGCPKDGTTRGKAVADFARVYAAKSETLGCRDDRNIVLASQRR